jgi:hypothetical protein
MGTQHQSYIRKRERGVGKRPYYYQEFTKPAAEGRPKLGTLSHCCGTLLELQLQYFTISYNQLQLILYGICIYIPYSQYAAEAMKTADAAVTGVFQVHMSKSRYAASSLVSIYHHSLFQFLLFSAAKRASGTGRSKDLHGSISSGNMDSPDRVSHNANLQSQ